MKMAVDGGTLIIKDADNVQFTVIKSWNKMKWDKKTQTLRGTADLELLDKLSGIVRLPLRRRAVGSASGPSRTPWTGSASTRSRSPSSSTP